MASGSSGRPNSGSKGFDFGSDDILCSYEDYPNQDSTNGSHSEPAISPRSGKEYHKNRLGRSIFPASYSPQEDTFNPDVASTVDKSMKKYADNIMRFLEGLSSRVSQLELYCYNLDKSIGEMRSDLTRGHGEADTKLKSLDKHIQEVHRSVQILRDKQELADAQKELAKLQHVQKESSSSSHSQSNEERTSPPISDPKTNDNLPDTNNQQLALALPHQVAPQQQPVAPSLQALSQNTTHQSYYLSSTQLPNPPASVQLSHGQYMPSESQYRPPQMQDITMVSPHPTYSQVNHAPPVQSFSQYLQQVSQQLPQHPSMQTQIRPSPAVYTTTYPQSQPTNSPSEPLPISSPMQHPYSGIPPQGSNRGDTMSSGYSGAGRVVPQQLPPRQIKGGYGAQPGDGYATSGPHPTLPPGSTYMMYDGEGGRSHYPPEVSQFAQGGYSPASASHPNTQVNTPPNLMIRNPQFNRNYAYSELIEKLAGMGFRADHVASVIQRMEDSGQSIDFNALIDRLNMHSSGAPQRGWSG